MSRIRSDLLISTEFISFVFFLLLVAIVVLLLIRRKIIVERLRCNALRMALVENAGIIKAMDFTPSRLRKILREIESDPEGLKNNPHLIYDIVSRTETNYTRQ